MTEIELSERLGQLAGMPAAEFVLHRKPMLFLDRLVAIGPEFASCEWLVSEESEFLVPKRGIPAYTGVEHMAQCVAVHAGACERVHGFPPRQGLLLGTRHYRACVRYFELGSVYQVECKQRVQNSDGMASFDCQILLNGKIIIEARLAVLQRQQGELLDG